MSNDPIILLDIVDGTGAHRQLAVVSDPDSGALIPLSRATFSSATQVSEATPLPVTIPSGEQPLDVIVRGSVAGPITAGGAAAFAIPNPAEDVVVFVGGTVTTGAYITNPADAGEDLFVDPVNVIASPPESPGPNGTTTRLVPGQTWTAPGGLTGAVHANSATEGHTFVAVRY